jgi:hypothetical protein
MNMADKQLKVEKEEVVVRGQHEYERIAIENNEHTEQIERKFEHQKKHALKEEFNEWEVGIGHEDELQQQCEAEKEQTAALIEKTEAVDAEPAVRRQNLSIGKEGRLKHTHAVAELTDMIMKAKHEKRELETEFAMGKKSIIEKHIKIEDLMAKNIKLKKHRR